MVISFLVVVIVALSILFLSLFYDKREDTVPAENYLAGSDSKADD